MIFNIKFSVKASDEIKLIESSPDKKVILKAIRKTLGFMEVNLRHPSLKTHEYTELSKRYGVKVFESYVQNRTPGAYRIFWFYGPKSNEITVISIVPHP